MMGTRWMEALSRAVEQTQAQLNKLVETVGELTAAVQVEGAKRADLERRVDEIVEQRQQQQQQTTGASLNLRASLQVAALSGGISLVVGEVIKNWR